MSKIRLIGIGYEQGSGKDTFAAMLQYYLAKDHLQKTGGIPDMFPTMLEFINAYHGITRYDGWVTKRMADKLKECASIILGVPRENFEDQEFKKMDMPPEWNITRDYSGTAGVKQLETSKMTYRQFLQEFGTECGRAIHPNFWVNALYSEFKKESKWIIPDIRFPNEADRVKEEGGILINVQRNIERTVGTSHASETAMAKYYGWDFIIKNDGSLEDLALKAESLLKQTGMIHETNAPSKEEESSG